MSYIPSNPLKNKFENNDGNNKIIDFNKKKKDRSCSFSVSSISIPPFAPVLKKKVSLREVSPLKLSIPKEEDENEYDDINKNIDKLNLNDLDESEETQKDSNDSIQINRFKERSNSVFLSIPNFSNLFFSMQDRDKEIQNIMRAQSTDDSLILKKLRQKNL